MNELTVVKFIEKKSDYLFPNNTYSETELEDALLNAPDSFEYHLKTISFRNPSTLQLIAFFPGSLGIDRFVLGDIPKGIIKYFTFGGFGIWWLLDIISAKKRCRAYNCQRIMKALANPSLAPQRTPKINIDLEQIGKTVTPAAKAVVQGVKDLGSTFEIK